MNNIIKKYLDKIITDLENNTFQFKYNWSINETPPKNFISKHIYQGINSFILKYFSGDCNFLTFLQAKERGIVINKGSKGYPIIFYSLLENPSKDDPNRKFPYMKHSFVFGLSQTNLDNNSSEVLTIHKPQEVIDNFKDKPEILTGERNPCYIPSIDKIHMPTIDKFTNPESYYTTLFHELSHSTKSDERLNRNYKDYAKEELLAELSSMLLCNYCGINSTMQEDNRKAYLQNWLSNAKKSPKYLLDIIKDAEAVFNYILQIKN